MISLGILDLILLLLLILAVYLSVKRRGLALSVLATVILVVVLLERVAPGTMASIGTTIQGIDQVNNAGPHLLIQPIVRFQK